MPIFETEALTLLHDFPSGQHFAIKIAPFYPINYNENLDRLATTKPRNLTSERQLKNHKSLTPRNFLRLR